MCVNVREWLQLSKDERLRVLEYVAWEQRKRRRQ